MSQSGSQFYEGYWQSGKSWSPSGGTISPEEAALFQKHLKPGVVCLDYGCGDGTRYGKSLMEGGMTYRGFDISKTAVETARAAGVSVDLLGENGATGLADESCDVAICFEVFEHLLEPNLALAEIFRVLKPGGHLLASVPNAAFWWTRLEFLATGYFNPGGSPLTARSSPWRDPHIRFFSRSLFGKMIASAGFDVLRVSGEAFSLLSLPYLYKSSKLRPVLERLSTPVQWMGRCFPGVMSGRLFAVAKKPAQSSGAA